MTSTKRINTRFKNQETWVELNINPEFVIAVCPHREIISSCLILLVNNPGWIEVDCYYNTFLKELNGEKETIQ